MNTLKSNNQLTIEDVIPKSPSNNDEAKKELDKIKEIQKNVDRVKLLYEKNEYTYSFKDFQTLRTFGKDIYDSAITIKGADEYQNDLLVEIMNFKENTNQKVLKKTRKRNCS